MQETETRFESSVKSYDTKTSHKMQKLLLAFESSVKSYDTKTSKKISLNTSGLRVV